MDTIIIYNSKTGYTKSYAEMLSKTLVAEVLEMKALKSVNLSDYDTILYGAGVMAGNINGLKKMIKQFKMTTGKNIVLFAVGANAPSKKNLEDLMEKNLKVNGIEYPLFYLQGGFDPEKLSTVYRVMLNKISKRIKVKEEKNPLSLSDEDREFLEFFNGVHDYIRVENIDEIVEYVQSL